MNREFASVFSEWKAARSERERCKERIARKFMLEFNYNSNHIEGNTLTYGQTEMLLLFGKVIGDATMRDLEEMKAHNVGLKMVIDESKRSDRPLTETFIRQLHQIMLREDYEAYRVLPNGKTTSYTIHAGQYKSRPNSVITRTGERFEYASPEETPALMTDLVAWYNKEATQGSLTPLELAALFHYRYIRIHPFEDDNGRIARLMVNFILSRYDYPMVVVPSQSKERYLTALNGCDTAVGTIPSEGAHATLEQIAPFIDYLESLLVAEMRNDLVIVNGGKVPQWWYHGELVRLNNERLNQIVTMLIDNPHATIRGISKELGINKSMVQCYLHTLQERGYLIRVGSSTKGGAWHIRLTRV